MKRKLFIIALLLLFLITFYTEIRECYDLICPIEYFFYIPILILIVLALIICSIIDLVKKSKYWIIPTLIIIVMISGFSIGRYFQSWQNKNTIKNMDNVILAIENYSKVNNKYPDSLSQLVPKWLDEIPVSYCGFKKLKFLYSRINNQDYNECVRLQIYDRPHIAYRIYDRCYYEAKSRITFWDSFNH